jgi:hypothetical protein
VLAVRAFTSLVLVHGAHPACELVLVDQQAARVGLQDRDEGLYGRVGGDAATHSGSLGLLGGGLAALPLLYELVVHLDNFLYSTLFFHLTATIDWYQSQELSHLLTVRHKIYYLWTTFAHTGNLSILLVAAGSVTVLVGTRAHISWHSKRFSPAMIAFVALFISALIFSSLPTATAG